MVMNLHFARAFDVFFDDAFEYGGTQDAVIRNSGDWIIMESFRIPCYKMTRYVGRSK
jgi:hypothetical protein